MRSTIDEVGGGHTEQQKDQCQIEEHEGGGCGCSYNKLFKWRQKLDIMQIDRMKPIC